MANEISKEELLEFATRLNNGRTYRCRKNLFDILQQMGDGSRLSPRTVDGWFLGRPIERYWMAIIRRLMTGEVTISRQECDRICRWFEKLDPGIVSDEDTALFKRLKGIGDQR